MADTFPTGFTEIRRRKGSDTPTHTSVVISLVCLHAVIANRPAQGAFLDTVAVTAADFMLAAPASWIEDWDVKGRDLVTCIYTKPVART